MKTARITSRQARESVDLAFDQDIWSVTKEEEMAAEVAEIDALIDEVDRELAAEAGAAASRALRPFTDVDRARRAQRRAVRDALALLDRKALIAGVPGQGKSVAAWVVRDGEVAA
ncbi:hypothetical protein [Prauserella muralis]|uniref:Uncharacterized protein n=1 Tax=Prauserella muralis TaxID=588067 RepID=A0A2V4B9S9_9PSEU|nr:hypothetical protein [Prauserella muralis]PXY32114.1 hypothetical protein BAY60_07395 [Prauserella muralis]TWE24237.1 hypothetical protein FHX69_5550 [Prauserella muralis]